MMEHRRLWPWTQASAWHAGGARFCELKEGEPGCGPGHSPADGDASTEAATVHAGHTFRFYKIFLAKEIKLVEAAAN